MAHAGLSIGTATGGGTILVDNIGGTLWPVNKLAVGGPGTATPVHAGAPLPVSGTVVAAGTQVVSGTTVAAGTQVVAGTVAISGTIPVSGAGGGGTVAVSGGTVTALAAGTQLVSGTVSATVNVGTVAVSSGTVNVAGTTLVAGTVSATVNVGTVAVSSGTVTALAAGTQIVSGTVVTSGGSGPGTVAISGGTIGVFSGTALVAGTVTSTPSGTQPISGTVGVSGTVPVTHGRTLASTAVTANSGTTTIVTPGGGTQVRVYAALLSAGTTGAFILRSGNNLPLSGTVSVDQYGGFAHSVTPPAHLWATAAGSALQIVVTSGTPNIGGVISYWLE